MARKSNQWQEIMTSDSKCEVTFDPVSHGRVGWEAARRGEGWGAAAVGPLHAKPAAEDCKHGSGSTSLRTGLVTQNTRMNDGTNKRIKVTALDELPGSNGPNRKSICGVLGVGVRVREGWEGLIPGHSIGADSC